MKKTAVFAILVCLLAALCLPAFAQAEDATTITLEQPTVIVAVDKTVQLKPTIEPRAARKAGVTYQISDESVATVDEHGKVKGVAVGTCELTIVSKHDESASLTVPVQVVIPVSKITVAEVEPIHVGDTVTLACTYEPEEATLKKATYTSSSEKVATVDENGVVTAIARGKADITVYSVDGAAKARVRINVLQQPTSVTVTPDDVMLATGKTTTLKAAVEPHNADNKKVIWTSSDENIATVDSRGRVTSVNPGTVYITATARTTPLRGIPCACRMCAWRRACTSPSPPMKLSSARRFSCSPS